MHTPKYRKGEYYFSEKIWPVFLATGILFCAVSIFTSGIVSVLCALIGGACLWSIRELKEQRKRVQKDRFPQNKKRSQNASAQGKISEAIIIRPIQKKDNGQLSPIIRAIFEEFGAPKENSVYSDKHSNCQQKIQKSCRLQQKNQAVFHVKVLS